MSFEDSSSIGRSSKLTLALGDLLDSYSLNDICCCEETLPEDSIFRAIIVSPSFQLPWAWQRLSNPKPYGARAIPLLLLHRDPLPNVPGFETGSILTHVP